MVAEDDLLEWAVVHRAARYGTPRQPVDLALASGRPAMLEIDLQGARQVRETMPEALFVFLKPPSWDELVRRLVGRGTETEEERERRLATAREELAAEAEFDVTHRQPRSSRCCRGVGSLDDATPATRSGRSRRYRRTVRLRVSTHHRRRGRHQPLDRRPADQDRQQVQAGPLQRQARPPDQRLLLPARRGPAGVRRPARRHPRAGEAALDRAARDQRGPADLRGRRPGRARRRGGRRPGRRRRRRRDRLSSRGRTP